MAEESGEERVGGNQYGGAARRGVVGALVEEGNLQDEESGEPQKPPPLASVNAYGHPGGDSGSGDNQQANAEAGRRHGQGRHADQADLDEDLVAAPQQRGQERLN